MTPKLDLRIQKTYLALTSTFLKMLEEMPFEELTVNELCSRAMVRRATFYKHFADKYEFFTFVVKEIQRKFLERSAQMAGQPQHFYYNTIVSVFDFIDENRPLVASARKSSMFPVLLNIVSEQTARDVQERLEQDEREGKPLPASPVILAQLFTGALINASRWWLLENEKTPKEQMVEQTAALLLPQMPPVEKGSECQHCNRTGRACCQ